MSPSKQRGRKMQTKRGFRKLHADARAKRWIIRQLLTKHGGCCAACGEPVALSDGDRRATIDHVVPLSKGGSDDLSNLQLLCQECNEEKGDEAPEGDA